MVMVGLGAAVVVAVVSSLAAAGGAAGRPAAVVAPVAVGSPAVAASLGSAGGVDGFEVLSDHHVSLLSPTDGVRVDLGGVAVDGVAATGGGFGKELVVVHGSDGAVWYRWRSAAGSFSRWLSLGGHITARPAVAETGTSVLVTVLGTDGRMYERMWTAGGWSASWRAVNFHFTGTPALGTTSAGEYVVYGRGSDGRLWASTRGVAPTAAWPGLVPEPTRAGLSFAEPAVDPVPGGGVYVRGADTACWWFDPTNPSAGWRSLGFRFTDGFGAATIGAGSGQHTFLLGRSLHHQLYYQFFLSGLSGAWNPYIFG